MSKRWTDHEIKSLTQYVSDGKTDAETASLLGRSEGGVKYKKQALGLAVKEREQVQIDPTRACLGDPTEPLISSQQKHDSDTRRNQTLRLSAHQT